MAGAAALTFALIAPLAGAAQDDPDDTPAGTDGTGVARVSLLDGNVALQRGDASDSLTAAINAPILGGDYVTTGDASHAEIEVDGYTQVRLDSDVQMRFTHLDTNARSMQLAAGTIDVRLLHGTDGTTAIDTPSVTVQPQQSGSYRVTVTADGQTLVTVRSGDAQVVTPQGPQDLQPGTTLIATGAASNPTIQTEAAVAIDEFDRFNLNRDRAYQLAAGDTAYVDSRIAGVEDLPSYGRWVDDGSYGQVWVPRDVAPDWAPYRNGRWVWEEGYGWTWVAAEPWGWAPYHYGSWYNSPTYGWAWYPPRPAPVAVIVPWRPALVAFIGFGIGGGFSLGFGGGATFANIGWVPLAPFEAYHPWWTNRYGVGGPTVVNHITNVTNVTNITNVTVYKNVQYNAVSSVSSQHFLQGDFSHNVAVTAPQLHQAQVFHGAIPVVPTASNLRFAGSAAPPAVAVRPALMQRSFAGSATPVQRTPFTAQRVAFATTTHAVVTPLHFKDAESTPLEGPHPAEHTAPAAVTPSYATPEHATPATANAEHAAPQTDHPAGATPATNSAWARFNATRTPENTAAERSASGAGFDRTAPASPAYHAAPVHPDVVHPASAGSAPTHAPLHTDAAHPSAAAPSTYHAASTHSDTYHPAQHHTAATPAPKHPAHPDAATEKHDPKEAPHGNHP